MHNVEVSPRMFVRWMPPKNLGYKNLFQVRWVFALWPSNIAMECMRYLFIPCQAWYLRALQLEGRLQNLFVICSVTLQAYRVFVWWTPPVSSRKVRTSLALIMECTVYKNLFHMCCTPTCTPSHTGMHKCMFVQWTPPSMESLISLTAITVCNHAWLVGSLQKFVPTAFIVCTSTRVHVMRHVWSNTWLVGKLEKFVPIVFVICTPTCAPSSYYRLSSKRWYDEPLQAWHLWNLWLARNLFQVHSLFAH